MARVVCQVLAQPERLTFLWSDGARPFEPYHKTGDNLRAFHALAQQARERLRQLTTAPPHETSQAAFALAQVGHELYRALFQADGNEAEAASAVEGWLTALVRDGAVERLELLTDAPQLLPWNVLHDTPPDEHSFRAAADTPQLWQSFWGARYALTVDRRVSPLRARPVLDKPAVLLAFDPALREHLPEEQRKRLHDLAQAQAVRIAESVDELAQALGDSPVDFLYLLCRVSDSALHLGGKALAVDVLADLLRRHLALGEGRSDTLVFLNACRGEGPETDVSALLQALGTRAALGPQVPLPIEAADHFGLEFLAGFLSRGERVGKLLQDLRGRIAPVGLLYTGYCPAGLRASFTGEMAATAIRAEGAAEAAPAGRAEEGPEPLPLPETPFRPLLPYEAEDRPLFVGREGDTENVAELLDEAGVRLVLLHGESGSGKSSLLRAGVIPYLEEQAIGFRILEDRTESAEGDDPEADNPLLLIRATGDLAGQLAAALRAYCARPYRYMTPAGKEVLVDLPAILASFGEAPPPLPPAAESAIQTGAAGIKPAPEGGTTAPMPPAGAGLDERALRDMLRRRPNLAGRILAALAEKLPHELILVIEQAEEIFTLARTAAPERGERALALLRGIANAPARMRMLVSVRTEYVGHLTQAFEDGPEERAKVRSYLLRDLDKEALLEAVLLPTMDEPIPGSTDVPWSKYLCRYEQGVAERIVEEVLQAARERQQPILPLLQVTCHRLFQLVRFRPERVIRSQDVDLLVRPPGFPWGQFWLQFAIFVFLSPMIWAIYRTVRKRPAQVSGSVGGLPQYVEFLVQRLCEDRPKRDRRAFENLLEKLYVRQPDGTVVRKPVAEERLAAEWGGSTPLPMLIEEAAAADVRLLEVDLAQVSLAHDVLAVAEEQRAQDRRLQTQSRERIKDTLWIMIPLLILSLVYTWTWIVAERQARSEFAKADKERGAVREGARMLKSQVEHAAWPLYAGQIAQAQEALRAGDPLRARQYLQMQWPALLREGKIENDYRSFEWYYLMRQLQSARHELLGHRGMVAAVALSADGKVLASAGQDGHVRLWDTVKGQIRAVFKGHKGPVQAVALAPDGKTLAAGDDARGVKLWDVGTPGKETVRVNLDGHEGPVYAVAYSADGNTLATAAIEQKDGSEVGTVRLWDAGTKKERITLTPAPPAVWALAFAADGKTLATGGKEDVVQLWDTTSGKRSGALHGHVGWVRSVAFAADGKTLASGSYDATVKLWEPQPRPAMDVLTGHKGWVNTVAFSPDDKWVASAGADGTIKLWEVVTGKEHKTLSGHKGTVLSLSFAPDGKELASAGADKTVRIWNLDASAKTFGDQRAVLEGHTDVINVIEYAPSGQALVSGSNDQTVRIWRVDPDQRDNKDFGNRLGTLRQQGPVRAMTIMPRTGYLVTSGDDGRQLLVRDLEAAKKVGEPLVGHTAEIRTLAYWPGTKKFVVSGAADRTLKVWDVESGKEVATLRGHLNTVSAVAFSRTDPLLCVSGGWDGLVKLWNPQPGIVGERLTLSGHIGPVQAVAVSSDRRTIASAGRDGTVRLWRAAEAPVLRHARGEE